jgi:hypothetical protein
MPIKAYYNTTVDCLLKKDAEGILGVLTAKHLIAPALSLSMTARSSIFVRAGFPCSSEYRSVVESPT